MSGAHDDSILDQFTRQAIPFDYQRALAEQGRLVRFALLARDFATTQLAQIEVPKAVKPLHYSAFTSETEALGWLEA